MSKELQTIREALEAAQIWVEQMREGVNAWGNGSVGLDARCENLEAWLRGDVRKALSALDRCETRQPVADRIKLRAHIAEVFCDYDPTEPFLEDGSLPSINRVMAIIDPYLRTPSTIQEK